MVAIVRRAWNRKIAREHENGQIIRATAQSLMAFRECCCEEGSVTLCYCDDLESTLDLRIKATCLNHPKCTDYDFPAELTEQAVGTLTNPPAIQCDTVHRYWKSNVGLACGSPPTFDVEAVCCGPATGSGRGLHLRIDGGPTWHLAGNADDICSNYWEFLNTTEVTDTIANCGNCPPPPTPSKIDFYVKRASASYPSDC